MVLTNCRLVFGRMVEEELGKAGKMTKKNTA
jgi:hypothetical protein